MDKLDLETHTPSVPAASAMMLAGYDLLGIRTRRDGRTVFRFSPAARDTLNQFFKNKEALDTLLDNAGSEQK